MAQDDAISATPLSPSTSSMKAENTRQRPIPDEPIILTLYCWYWENIIGLTHLQESDIQHHGHFTQSASLRILSYL